MKILSYSVVFFLLNIAFIISANSQNIRNLRFIKVVDVVDDPETQNEFGGFITINKIDNSEKLIDIESINNGEYSLLQSLYSEKVNKYFFLLKKTIANSAINKYSKRERYTIWTKHNSDFNEYKLVEVNCNKSTTHEIKIKGNDRISTPYSNFFYDINSNALFFNFFYKNIEGTNVQHYSSLSLDSPNELNIVTSFKGVNKELIGVRSISEEGNAISGILTTLNNEIKETVYINKKPNYISVFRDVPEKVINSFLNVKNNDSLRIGIFTSTEDILVGVYDGDLKKNYRKYLVLNKKTNDTVTFKVESYWSSIGKKGNWLSTFMYNKENKNTEILGKEDWAVDNRYKDFKSKQYSIYTPNQRLGNNRNFTGKLNVFNYVNKSNVTIETNQADSEVLYSFDDNTLLYRKYDELRIIKINGGLIVKDELLLKDFEVQFIKYAYEIKQ
tara:strand:+ start:1164 stop:2495 length:1332 start_codon:yes stop_codon:yes gene_type:complete